MKKYLYLFILLLLIFSCEYEDYDDNENFQTPLAECIDGIAKINGTDQEYSCSNYNLMGHISLEEMDAEAGNDCWGWTDPVSGKEYALMGLNNGTGFIDISDPTNPIYLGKLPTATDDSSWRDLKVFNDHVYIVSEAHDHGLQVFDLTKLRGLESKQIFLMDYLYNGYGHAHNIAINEDSGYAYTAGAGSADDPKGIHALNITDPKFPVLELEFADIGYSHDIQVVKYKGLDTDYFDKEIYIGSNENKVVIVDVSDKTDPKIISNFYYDHQYTHQSWLTNDHKYLLMGDELDELDFSDWSVVKKTRTIIIDLTDLDNPKHHYDYISSTDAIDHNGYVKGTKFYLASYTAGLRVVDILNIDQKAISEIGFFDTYNDDNIDGSYNNSKIKQQDPGDDHSGKKGNSDAFNGAWSVYPFFKSDNIIISDINSGLFIVKKQN